MQKYWINNKIVIAKKKTPSFPKDTINNFNDENNLKLNKPRIVEHVSN